MGNLVQMPENEPEKKPDIAMKCGVLVGAEAETKSCGQEAFHKCTVCGAAKCGEHTSNVDPSQCTSCCKDVEVTVKVFSRETDEYDEFNDEMVLRKYQAKSIHLGGEHWLSNQTIIASMPDIKLKSSIEYYKQMVKMMEEELLHRKMQKDKKYLAENPILRRHKAAGVTSVTTEKRTTVRRKKQVSADDLISKLASANIDPKKLLELLQQKVAAKNLGIPPTGTEKK